jgi:hypothetical protein
MTTNARRLAVRDAAMLAVMGGLPADFGSDYGFGADFGDDPPTPANQMRAWQEKQATKGREALLYPNRGSSAKIQRYCFAINQTVAIDTPEALSMTGKPETEFRPQRVTCNVNMPGFITLDSLKVANVGVLVGGTVDAYDFNPNGQDQELDVPTLTPANEVKATGDYTGTIPVGPGLVAADAFIVALSFKGPASMAGG